MAFADARQQYLKTQIETASKEQLVVMLFDGIIRFTEQARKAIENKEIENSHNALMRAQAIIMELICTVDKEKGGEVASNLMGLHAYAFNALIVCNLHKDVAKIDEVQKIYRELREGWVGAMDNLGIGSSQKTAAAAQAVQTAAAAGKPGSASPAAPRPAVASIPKAPAAAAFAPKTPPPAAPKAAPAAVPAPTPAKPAVGTGGSGIMAAAKASPAAATPPSPAIPVAAPMAPKANGYGIGRTAMMAGMMQQRPAAPAPAAAPVPAPVAAQPAKPAAPAVPAAQTPKQVAAPVVNPNQAAMLNAYQAKSRSIA